MDRRFTPTTRKRGRVASSGRQLDGEVGRQAREGQQDHQRRDHRVEAQGEGERVLVEQRPRGRLGVGVGQAAGRELVQHRRRRVGAGPDVDLVRAVALHRVAVEHREVHEHPRRPAEGHRLRRSRGADVEQPRRPGLEPGLGGRGPAEQHRRDGGYVGGGDAGVEVRAGRLEGDGEVSVDQLRRRTHPHRRADQGGRGPPGRVESTRDRLAVHRERLDGRGAVHGLHEGRRTAEADPLEQTALPTRRQPCGRGGAARRVRADVDLSRGALVVEDRQRQTEPAEVTLHLVVDRDRQPRALQDHRRPLRTQLASDLCGRLPGRPLGRPGRDPGQPGRVDDHPRDQR